MRGISHAASALAATVLVAVGVAACGSEPPASGSVTSPAASVSTTSPPGSTADPVAGSSSPAIPASPTPAPDDARVAAAVADLAARYGYGADEIAVVSVEAVTWPSSGLGCPATGGSYDTAPVPGYRVVLGVGDLTFTYHGADGAAPIRCEFLD